MKHFVWFQRTWIFDNNCVMRRWCDAREWIWISRDILRILFALFQFCAFRVWRELRFAWWMYGRYMPFGYNSATQIIRIIKITIDRSIETNATNGRQPIECAAIFVFDSSDSYNSVRPKHERWRKNGASIIQTNSIKMRFLLNQY